MVMIEYEVLLLPEWYSLQKKGKILHANKPILRLFGSFLSENSLELAWSLTSADNLEVIDILGVHNRLISPPNPTIQLIFIPISRTFSKNLHIKKALIEILENHPRKNGQVPDFSNIIRQASGEIDKSQQEFIHLYFRENISEDQNPKFEFRVNKFFFGPITARFLQKIKDFPYIEIKNRKYHGIPMNLTLNDFLQKILLVELNCTCVKV